MEYFTLFIRYIHRKDLTTSFTTAVQWSLTHNLSIMECLYVPYGIAFATQTFSFMFMGTEDYM